nr:hypothetical protein CFP56_75754 [Quercus suber]
MSMLADCSKLKFKSSTQLFDEMLLQDIEPVCLDDLCNIKPIVKFLGSIAHDQMLMVSRKKNGSKESGFSILTQKIISDFFGIMIPTPICIHHQRRQKHLDPTLKRR